MGRQSEVDHLFFLSSFGWVVGGNIQVISSKVGLKNLCMPLVLFSLFPIKKRNQCISWLKMGTHFGKKKMHEKETKLPCEEFISWLKMGSHIYAL